MKKIYNSKLNCNTYELFAGEFFATSEKDAVLITLLGSCVAVCLIDDINGVIGMNHFMLPGKIFFDQPVPINNPKYGTCATDMLIMEMMKVGAVRQNLKAKVFGAGKIIEHFTRDIAAANAEFIQKYLQAIGIPVIAKDLGGKSGRKLYFFGGSEEVYIKRITDVNALPPEERVKITS